MPKTVLAARIMHETNTFSRVRTGLDDFRRADFVPAERIAAAYRGTRSAMGATLEAAERYGWSLVAPVSAAANPSGVVTREAFDHLAGLVTEAARAQGPIDGALLHLHGAMVLEDEEDGEGALLTRLRAVVGPDVPFVVTLDLHANVSDTMAREAALIAFRTYPHVDMYERALQGAALLDRAMRGEIRPRTVLSRRPTLRGFDNGRTQAGPMAEALRRAAAHEAAGEALVVSVCAGFTRADIADVGPTVTVTTNGEDPRGGAIADALMDYCWETRAYSTTDLRSVDEVVALALAQTCQPGEKPLVIADYTDNPGGGGYGDATNLLRGLVEAGAESVVLHAIRDPEAVQAAIAAGIGATATIAIGGKTDATLGGGPLTLTGRVAAITEGRVVARGPMGGGVTFDYGPSVRFTVGGIEVILITNNGQAKDLAQITSLGVDPRDFRTVCVKSMHHFRAAFEPIARQVVLVDTGALCSERFSAELFPKARRPIWPIDPLE